MTRKISILLLTLVFATTASAEFIGPGAATQNITSVKSISGMKDDAKVTLEGFIVNEIKSEHYTFKDATGEIEIEIEIDNKDFREIKVTPKTKIKIIGEVDKEWSSTTIEVDCLELVK